MKERIREIRRLCRYAQLVAEDITLAPSGRGVKSDVGRIIQAMDDAMLQTRKMEETNESNSER